MSGVTFDEGVRVHRGWWTWGCLGAGAVRLSPQDTGRSGGCKPVPDKGQMQVFHGGGPGNASVLQLSCRREMLVPRAPQASLF